MADYRAEAKDWLSLSRRRHELNPGQRLLHIYSIDVEKQYNLVGQTM